MTTHHRAYFCGILAAAALSSIVSGGEPDDAKTIGEEQRLRAVDHIGPNRYAVIVGIDDYDDDRIPDLTLCEGDARAVHALLVNPSIGGVPEENATVLLGAGATTLAVKKALNALRRIPTDSTVFIYFSGHGAKETGEAFWVTQDADLDDLTVTAMPDSDTRRFLGHIPSERVIVMLDCCYAAATIKEQKSVIDMSEALARFTGKGRAVLSAAGSGEEAIEARDLRHSVFTYYLLEGLGGGADANDDGVIVLPELTTYVDHHVADAARERGGMQKPVVDLSEVQEPAKFHLTIDEERLRRRLAESEREAATRLERLARLKQLYLDQAISMDVYQNGQGLLEALPEDLDQYDQRRRDKIIDMVDGRIEPSRIDRALAAIESPAQRERRLRLEAEERTRLEREHRIATLLDRAREMDSKSTGREALAALEKLLEFEPDHDEARTMWERIARYYGALTGDTRVNSIGMEMVYIAPGTFVMGSPQNERGRRAAYEKQHRVTLTQGYWMASTETTVAQFAEFCRSARYKSAIERPNRPYAPATISDDGRGIGACEGCSWRAIGDQAPVCWVNWSDANEFCRWLSRKEGKRYRLPTEAEWEYACRAGTTTAFWWGNSADQSWDKQNCHDQSLKQLMPAYRPEHVAPWNDGAVAYALVGGTKPNPWGLYDMLGNVAEWCADYHGPYPGGATTDPRGATSGSHRVTRGGSFQEWPAANRSAARMPDNPRATAQWVGFRVICEENN